MYCKVAALTVVKDEAAYIMDWISHCFYFGFEEVYIAVNRTTDRTMALLSEVANKDKRVKVYCTDWIDLFPNRERINIHMQYYSFCFLMSEAFKNQNITHVFPLDADEFWFSSDFETSISDYILSFPTFDMLSVHWAAQSGDDDAFMPPFDNNTFTLMNNVKSILSRDCVLHMKKYQLHIPEIEKDNFIHLNIQGEVAQRVDEKTQRIVFDSKLEMTSMILHRMLRSEDEYLSLLLKQRPSSNLPVKDNRNGLHKQFKSTLSISKEIKSKYRQYLLLQSRDYIGIISESRSDILKKLKKYEEIPIDIISLNISVFIKVLKGTKMLSSILERFLVDSTDTKKLRDIAISLEKLNINYSVKLIAKALELEANCNIKK